MAVFPVNIIWMSAAHICCLVCGLINNYVKGQLVNMLLTFHARLWVSNLLTSKTTSSTLYYSIINLIVSLQHKKLRYRVSHLQNYILKTHVKQNNRFTLLILVFEVAMGILSQLHEFYLWFVVNVTLARPSP